ncbi:MAG: hypothetical protein U5K81_02960 [Trueperaceae bacterium]|nr:hypothetical protein [Trueperaceae bacterium]
MNEPSSGAKQVTLVRSVIDTTVITTTVSALPPAADHENVVSTSTAPLAPGSAGAVSVNGSTSGNAASVKAGKSAPGGIVSVSPLGSGVAGSSPPRS